MNKSSFVFQKDLKIILFCLMNMDQKDSNLRKKIVLIETWIVIVEIPRNELPLTSSKSKWFKRCPIAAKSGLSALS